MSRLLMRGVLQQARNLMQPPSGLYAISVSTTSAIDPCDTMSTNTTVYCNVSTLAQAFIDEYPIFSDSSGTTMAATSWYSEDQTQWFFFDADKEKWGDEVLCGGSSLLEIALYGRYRIPCAEFNISHEFPAYLDDIGNFGFPITGAFVYEDDQGTIPVGEGYYAWLDNNNDVNWIQVGSNGEIIAHGKCD